MTVVPSDLGTEQALLGAMMMNRQAVEVMSTSLASSDFYRPVHGAIFSAIVELHSKGEVVDAMTVKDLLTKQGFSEHLGDGSIMIDLLNAAGPATSARQYGQIILDRSLRRRMMLEAQELITQATDPSIDAVDLLENHRTVLASMGSTIIDKEPDDISVQEFVNRPRQVIAPWAVHGLIRRRHKVMVVGGEGAGKSFLLRFIAICAAYGVHPFRHTAVAPIRTLIVDLENPEDALYDSFEMMLRQATRHAATDDPVSRLWWKPAGINLRNRVDVAEFENVLRVRRPDLVCLGPLYASYENTPSDFGWESAAREVQTVLKRLMVRYDFGLLIEDHAPQADSSGKRQMRPYGSSFWRRWPDIGIGMEPIGDTGTGFRLSRWRGDRVPTDWPDIIERGSISNSPWPFTGRWDPKPGDA